MLFMKKIFKNFSIKADNTQWGWERCVKKAVDIRLCQRLQIMVHVEPK
jgi:hypothetical protein